MRNETKQRYRQTSNTMINRRSYRTLYLTKRAEQSQVGTSSRGGTTSARKKISYRSSTQLAVFKRKTPSTRAERQKKKQINKYKQELALKKDKLSKQDRLNAYQGYSGYKTDLYQQAQKKSNQAEAKNSQIYTQRTPDRMKEGASKQTSSNQAANSQTIDKNVRTSKKLSTLTRKKIDKSLKKHVTPKQVFRNKIQEMMIDTIGRDDNGELNFIGIILAIILLIPVLFLLIKIVLITSVIIAIISVFIAIWSFIVGLFTIKTEDMALEEAYRYVTELDAEKNKEVNELYNQLVADEETDEVYFIVNGVRSNPNNFLFSSNGDVYIYFLNAKYENYDIRKRSGSDKYEWITDEIQGIHKHIFHWETAYDNQVLEHTVVTEDPETGEIEEEVVEEVVQIATLRVTWSDFEDYLKTYPEELEEEENDKFEPIQELDRFENKIFLENPLGKNTYATVVEKYGYRGRDNKTKYDEMILAASPGDPVYASSDEKVVGIYGDTVESDTPSSKKIKYSNLKNIRVKEGQVLTPGQLIGETKGNLEIQVIERRSWPHGDAILYPAAYIDNLVFSYPEDAGYHDSSGGITGDLIRPPDAVLQWQDLVIKACEKYGITGFENIILAIIWEESGGTPIKLGTDEEGNPIISMDIMQASESLGLPVNSLETAEESIDAGVSYFAEGLQLVEEYNLDKRAAIQAYNYGHGFIHWLVEANTDYSFEMGRLFGREKSSGRTVNYSNPVAQALGYSWRYEYGNMFYVNLITQHIMTNAGELVAIAIEELGYPNGDKYWRWFGLANRVEWCAIFVSWVADQAGYLEQDRILKSSSCIEMVRWFTDRDKYEFATSNYIPREGDIVFFDWSGNRTGKDHVGIVEFSDGHIIQVIEGNSGNMVSRQIYTIDTAAISGYGITRSDGLE